MMKYNKILRKYKVLIVNRDSRCYNVNIIFSGKSILKEKFQEETYMRYEIKGDTFTGSYLLSGGRREDDHRRRRNVLECHRI